MSPYDARALLSSGDPPTTFPVIFCELASPFDAGAEGAEGAVQRALRRARLPLHDATTSLPEAYGPRSWRWTLRRQSLAPDISCEIAGLRGLKPAGRTSIRKRKRPAARRAENNPRCSCGTPTSRHFSSRQTDLLTLRRSTGCPPVAFSQAPTETPAPRRGEIEAASAPNPWRTRHGPGSIPLTMPRWGLSLTRGGGAANQGRASAYRRPARCSTLG